MSRIGPRMGGSCSLQRQRALWEEQQQQEGIRNGERSRTTCRGPVRHSVDTEVSDDSIAALYPVQDNYVSEGGLRSPKSLRELCVEAVCRSLPYLDGELPPGLPPDIVDSIISSLMQRAALNATTLRALRSCEFQELSLANCRGVTDEWLEALNSKSTEASSPSTYSTPVRDVDYFTVDSMDLDAEMIHAKSDDRPRDCASPCSSDSFVSTSSSPYDMEITDTMMTPASVKSLVNPDEDTKISALSITQPYFSMKSSTTNMTLLDLRGSQRLTDRGLIQLQDLGALEVVRLDNCHGLVGRGLVALANSPRLHTLSMANCRRLTDDALINISHLTSLTALALGGCRCLTDRSLAAISNLYELRHLDLSQCDLITDESLEHLHDLEFLEELSLGWCRSITDRGIGILTSQPERESTLRILRLARCRPTDIGIKHLRRLKALEELDLNGCSGIGSMVLGETLAVLPNITILDVSYCSNVLRSSWQGKIDRLKTLELCYSGVRDVHLSRLTSLPALEELNLDSCPVGDWAIAHLGDNNVVPNLITFDLADTDLTDLGMVHLPKFTKLTKLSLFYCNITNMGLRHLAGMKSLEVLNLDSREIGDEGIAHLRGLQNLKSLDLFSGRITDAGCMHLAKIKSLESLELCGGGIGDLGCSLLASLENISSLNLSQNERISNRGAAALAALTKLKALNLSNTRVNANALRFFKGLVQLQSLALYGCRGIEEGSGLETLQSELPSLKCLRLNSSNSKEDGTVPQIGTDDEDQDDESNTPLERTVLDEPGAPSDDEMEEIRQMDDASSGSSSYSDYD
eukprot:CAMPEP_0118719786 /NCGR_PEP_ID=MMETSP0800-20121206/29712_1 /TAXON_ID=210618 ORGANISM="Striatella unipunctata, Strain CCMP2910" /NCGR_SAMPLE_ID=MMETSP0800 /ASSEMBLY_ACC=CAM_ASM_000638 /LENGTH=804 /DNA_ID=CAMNT_0006627281 /DNA_START=49 /DNA_END=2463 /DNA_ORIENTATION=-